MDQEQHFRELMSQMIAGDQDARAAFYRNLEEDLTVIAHAVLAAAAPDSDMKPEALVMEAVPRASA
jgi:hypothetical protein